MANCLYCNQDYEKQGGCNCTIPVKTADELRIRVEHHIRNYELQLPRSSQEKGVWLENEISKLKTRLEGI